MIDPATGEVLADGEQGELVFTSLTKEALPIVRFRTRDLTRLLPGTARTMRRIEKVTGRSDDMLIVRGVNLFPTQIEELILRVPGSRRTSSSSLSAEAARRAHGSRRGAARGRLGRRAAALRAALADLIKETSASPSPSTCSSPDLIERSAGKAQRVLDLRPGVSSSA